MNNQPKIRFIVETITSERDRNGNCYHFARITSTLTGRSLSVQVGGNGNARALVKAVGDTWDSLHSVEITIPKRQWQQHASEAVSMYEHEIRGLDILALEQVQP